MKKIQKEDIINLSESSNISKQALAKTLEEKVYNDRSAWLLFIRYGFLALGIGFTIAGLIFFFAYNWSSIPKFAKMGIVQGLLIVTFVLSIVLKTPPQIGKILLTASSVLVGVLFAVFGQIYQTGANAFDFFLAWTIFITLWVFITNFAPLSLLYIVLINTTLVLYSQQVAKDWSFLFITGLLFLLNTLISTTALALKTKHSLFQRSNWLIYVVSLAAASFGTVAMIHSVIDDFNTYITIQYIVVAGSVLIVAIRYKDIYHLTLVLFSFIIVCCAWFLSFSDGEAMLLFISVFILTAISFLIKGVLHLQKKWKNGE